MKNGWIILMAIILLLTCISSCEGDYDDPWTNYDETVLFVAEVDAGDPRFTRTGTADTVLCISTNPITAAILGV